MHLQIDGTYEEILSFAKGLATIPTIGIELSTVFNPIKKEEELIQPKDTIIDTDSSGKQYIVGRRVDIYIGDTSIGFAKHKSFCSIMAAADFLGTTPANIHRYINAGKPYKKIYLLKSDTNGRKHKKNSD